LDRCLLTAAIRCAPPQNRPLPAELLNCRGFLCEELRLLESKKVVLALGQIALNAVLNALLKNRVTIPKRSEIPFRHGGEWNLPGEVTLLSSYHPSRQNTQTGRLTRSMFHAIFDRASRLIEEAGRA
jgi:uracil-DNA glycosylase family 4